MPGYILPSQRILISSYGTGTKFSTEFEILVTDHPEQLQWQRVNHENRGIFCRSVLGGNDALHQGIVIFEVDNSSG